MKNTLNSFLYGTTKWIAVFSAALILFSAQAQSKIMEADQGLIEECFSKSYQAEYNGDYQGAIEALDRLYQINKSNYTVNLRLGWLHYMNGAFGSSENHYQAAIKAVSTSLEARAGYMLPLLAEGKYEDAESVAYQALSMDKHNYYASLRLAYALRLQGKYSTAENLALEMLELYPTDVYFLSELGLVYVGEGDNAAAKDVFYEVLALDPDNVTALMYVE